jgi:predicted GNAT family N-acyltransferase
LKKAKSNFIFKKVDHNSPAYWEIIDLRHKILRKPLGLELTKQELMAESHQFHFGYYKNEELVGCLVFVDKGNLDLKMRQVAIDEEFQGLGVGSKMVAESEKWAVENGYNKIVLHARVVAKNFYKKMSYQVVGSSFLEVGLPHFKLFKLLN